GERFLVSINMSEYQESHTVSQLKGSPPGYVGYGEGGILTEAVRQRPYSVVLLDEVEKAHIDVMELFYQVFDRGFMRDGEGREINFRNTIILATSNIGSDRIQQACMAEERPTADELRALIHDDLARHFQPALLARMKVVPYYSLEPSAMRMITQLKLRKIDRRLRAAHGIRFVFGDDVVDRIAERCTQVDAGARNIDFIIDRTLLPEASRALLLRLADDDALPTALHLGIDESGTFTYTFADAVDAHGDGVATDEAAVLTEEAPSETTSDPEDAPLA
ncbi:MAG: AAA family ATPase, partial [Bacteroidota bacterium]